MEVLHRAPTAKPPFTLREIKKAIPHHCFNRSLLRSSSYLFTGVAEAALLCHLATTYIPMLPHPLPFLAWPLYWFLQGCVLMGLWVLGHECGHHAFSDYQTLDDTVGFVLHSCVFTPYFAWKISHRRHHSNTGSIDHDEVHVPKRRSKFRTSGFYLNNPLGRILTLIVKLSLGWHIYLSTNAAGRPYDRFANHYDPRSPIFSDNERMLVCLSDLGILAVACVLFTVGLAHGFGWLFCVYGGALTVMNAFVVIVTYLQHTHPSLPHYDDSEWNWLKGALSTMDRDYGMLNKVFNNVTTTHVVHHLFSTMPHYHAMEATKAIKPILGEYYQFDSTPFYKALWRESKMCLFVDEDEGDKKGVFWFTDKW